jgi:hypothetical protein
MPDLTADHARGALRLWQRYGSRGLFMASLFLVRLLKLGQDAIGKNVKPFQKGWRVSRE